MAHLKEFIWWDITLCQSFALVLLVK
jgi:hypothetical protein